MWRPSGEYAGSPSHAAFASVFRGEGEFGVAGDLGYRGELDGSLVRAPGLIVFDDGKITVFEGTYSEFLETVGWGSFSSSHREVTFRSPSRRA